MTAAQTVTVAKLWLADFRQVEQLELELTPGLTVFVGDNAQGKTTLLEAVAWIARARSFRGVSDHALVRSGQTRAVVRADVRHDGREQLFEAEIRASGRNRVQLNRTPVQRTRDLHGLLRVSVFAPDDLQLVKGGPAHRREYLDELLVALALRYGVAQSDYERVLKHRNALLRAGVRDATDRSTLEVFDDQLVSAATELTRGRLRLLDRLVPAIASAYRELAGAAAVPAAEYRADWSDSPLDESMVDRLPDELRRALASSRRKEEDRRVTLVGPHRDELHLTIAGFDARTHASQGEQRTLSLALRLAGHRIVTELTGSTPVLLLDDVFSELDGLRAAALVSSLPPGQTLLTTAGAVPAGVRADRTLQVRAGGVSA